MLSVKKKNFLEVEYIIQLLSIKRLKRAKEDLKVFKKTTNKNINQLLKSLLFYGFHQLIFKEYYKADITSTFIALYLANILVKYRQANPYIDSYFKR